MSDFDVLFLTKYGRKGASSRYRLLQYFPYFEEYGIHCSCKPLFSNEYLESLYATGERSIEAVINSYIRRIRDILNAQKYDVIVIEKELFPYIPAIFERLLSALNIPYIVDYDDAIFHNYDQSDRPIIRRLLGKKIDIVMREAEIVVVGNEYLASRAQQAGASQIKIIPTVIDLDRYPHVPPNENGTFTIGWIGSPTTANYVEQIAPALREVCNENDARVVLVGSGEVELPGVPHEVKTWSEETEIKNIVEFDVGIMPLEETPWERGKCGFKLIQYMGCGKPVVATPVGVNAEIAEDGHNGLHATTNNEWVTALDRLYKNRELAKTMGNRGRQRVEEQYSLTTVVPTWADILNKFSK
ncbi:Glycosyltransferase involved in cell wall bisynthesis [Haloplanus vescus]|uniref:Glycosyltransferase involved in cell wall bisynthesis n=1 Tax=Haloplanus vescus TaxID=555874 RepID=A0A1H3XI65_9EURY|nr:glycosyltransferase family 4 protein [Haloplanus vescus]SDZ98334.1 Glycosyltransferase involved in cell wall bisynthesis [Haloplanus vescus]